MRTGSIDRAREELQATLKDLRTQVAQVEQALAALNGGSRSGTTTSRTRRSPAKRVPKTERIENIKKYLGENPKASGADVAKAMEMQPSQAYTLLNEMVKEKIIKRGRDKTFSLADPPK